MIRFLKLNTNKIKTDLLDGFDRHQITDKVKLFDKGRLIDKDLHFEEKWDESKLKEVASTLKRISEENGTVIIAQEDNRTIGFVCLESEIFFNEYMNMPYLHVSYEQRNKGIGKKLFEMICKEAKNQGAKKIYISGHPSFETQMFYEKVGCVLAKKINQRLLEIEPYDIQLEKTL